MLQTTGGGGGGGPYPGGSGGGGPYISGESKDDSFSNNFLNEIKKFFKL